MQEQKVRMRVASMDHFTISGQSPTEGLREKKRKKEARKEGGRETEEQLKG